MKKAIIDKSGPIPIMVRCPHCNSFDRALEDAPGGEYRCDECNEPFELDWNQK